MFRVLSPSLNTVTKDDMWAEEGWEMIEDIK